jgi:hypothetical protein
MPRRARARKQGKNEMAKHENKVLLRSASGWTVKSTKPTSKGQVDVHVLPSKGGWTVKRGGASRAMKKFDSKEEAVLWARQSAKSGATDLVVHGRDGLIRSKDSYGNDPLPPKGDKR